MSQEMTTLLTPRSSFMALSPTTNTRPFQPISFACNSVLRNQYSGDVGFPHPRPGNNPNGARDRRRVSCVATAKGSRKDSDSHRLNTNFEFQRRNVLSELSLLSLLVATPKESDLASAAETIGKDPSCNSPWCLGVWDGLLADCPHDDISLEKLSGRAGCVSSQDDTPGVFAEPWDYSDNYYAGPSQGSLPNSSEEDTSYQRQMDLLIPAIFEVSKRNGDGVKILLQSQRYLRVLFKDGASGETSIGEFYYTLNDTTVQFRIGSTSSGTNGTNRTVGIGRRSLSNNARSEQIRKQLRYLKVPVLRNRKRSLIFVESDDWDGFGPGSAALGPPEEMSPEDVDGDIGRGGRRTRRGSDEVDPRLKIDWVQTFPVK